MPENSSAERPFLQKLLVRRKLLRLAPRSLLSAPYRFFIERRHLLRKPRFCGSSFTIR